MRTNPSKYCKLFFLALMVFSWENLFAKTEEGAQPSPPVKSQPSPAPQPSKPSPTPQPPQPPSPQPSGEGTVPGGGTTLQSPQPPAPQPPGGGTTQDLSAITGAMQALQQNVGPSSTALQQTQGTQAVVTTTPAPPPTPS